MKGVERLLLCVALSATVCTGVAFAEEEYAEEPVFKARVAHFPPLPDGWTLTVNDDNSINYKSPANANGESVSNVRFLYTKRTSGMDAFEYAQDYAETNVCADPIIQGVGFYTVSCKTSQTDAVIIGEPNNMYLIEVMGEYSSVSINMINSYLNDIVSGKHTFKNRDIGELTSEMKKKKKRQNKN